MLVLITYDVNTQDAAGVRRLNKIAKLCVKYGQRVQNSVFECLLEDYNYRLLQHELLKIADQYKYNGFAKTRNILYIQEQIDRAEKALNHHKQKSAE